MRGRPALTTRSGCPAVSRHRKKSKTASTTRMLMNGAEPIVARHNQGDFGMPTYVLNDDWSAQVRASGYGLDGGAMDTFVDQVRTELDGLVAQGIRPTRNHLTSAITTVRMRRGM